MQAIRSLRQARSDQWEEMKMLRYAPEGIGEQIVQIVGAISLITERDYDDPTMLANYSLQKIEEMKPDKIAAMARNVKAAVKDMPGREGMYLNGMIDAFEMFARILDGEKIPYKDAIRVMQQVKLRPIPADKFEQITQTADRSLTDMGFDGVLMSGSGSTVFGITRNEKLVERARNIMRNRRYFVRVTRILDGQGEK